MIIAPVRASLAFAEGRLDAMYHCSPGVLASKRISMLRANGACIRTVAGEGGLGQVGATSRTKRVYAAPGEASVPYLRPYDLFDYLPKSADLLSKSASNSLSRLMPEPGTILQTCSGRNLGPLAYADAFISRFVVSDDMLRLNIADEEQRLYTLAFLSTPTGQALLTRSKTGNVIDHLSAHDLGRVEVPFMDNALTATIVGQMRSVITARERARIRLDALISDLEMTIEVDGRTSLPRDGWTQRAAEMGTRLDPAFYDPYVAAVRKAVRSSGGVVMDDVAELVMPGQYKRYYVAAEHGMPILSGRQLLQSKLIHLQHIAARSLDFSAYALQTGMIVFGARGRAEERLAEPALITADRAGWLASHNVLRVRPKPGVNAGWLYLCLAAWQVQIQIKACAFGSVVDVITPADLAGIPLPPVDGARGDAALECWHDFALANSMEAQTVDQLEAAVLQASG